MDWHAVSSFRSAIITSLSLCLLAFSAVQAQTVTLTVPASADVNRTVSFSGTASGGTGDVEVLETGNPPQPALCTATPDGGNWSCDFTAGFQAAGSYTLEASYDGVASTPATSITINRLTPTATLSVAANADVGANVVFSGTISAPEASDPVPTGSVSVHAEGDPTTVFCNDAALDGSGGFSCSTSFSLSSTRSAVATYTPDSADADFYQSASSAASGITIVKIAPGTISLNLSDATPTFGQTITFTGTVNAGSTPGAPTPSGSVVVEFTDGSDLCTDAALDSNGAYSCAAAFPAAGMVDVRASYSGDDAYNSGASADQSVTVAKAATTTTITSQPAGDTPALADIPVTVSVATTGDGAGTPTGSVTVSWGGDSCPITLAAGTGSCNISPTSVDTRTISASYAETANFLASSGNGNSHAVVKATVTTTIASVSADPTVGEPVTVDFALATDGTETPSTSSGDPVFVTWGTDSCSGTVTGSVGSYTGSCSFTPSSSGTADLVATYIGGDFNEADASPAQDLTVAPAAANVSIEKCVANPGDTACPATVRTSLNPDEEFVYLLVVSRDAAAAGTDALAIRITDTLPTGLEGTSACNSTSTPCWEVCTSDNGASGSTLSPVSCPADASDGDGNVDISVELAPGSSTALVVNARVPSNETGPIINTGSVAIVADQGIEDSDSADDASTVSVDVDRSTDIEVIKTDDTLNAVPGTRHGYDITIRNKGFIAANGLSLYDQLPAEFVAGSGSWTCSASGGACCLADGASGSSCGDTEPVGPFAETDNTLERNVDMPSGSTINIHFSGDLAADATGTLSNTMIAELPAGLSENSPDNACVADSDGLDEECGIDDDTVLVPQGQLVLEHRATGRTDLGSDQYTGHYSITLSNEGPSDALGIDIDAPFAVPPFKAAGLSLQSCTIAPSGAGSCPATGAAGPPFDVSFDLDAGATITLLINAEIDGTQAGGPILNTATVSWAGNTNTQTESTSTLQLVRDAAITVLVDDGLSGSSGAVPGESLTYVIDISNEGPDDAIGAAVSNIFPAELDDVTWQCLARTPVPGDLSFLDFYSDPVNLTGVPSLALSPDGAHAYALGAGATAAVVAYQRVQLRGADFGKLAKIGVQRNGESADGTSANVVLGMSQPEFGVVSPDGRHLYVSSPADNAIVLFTRNRNPASADFGQLGYGSTITDALLGGVSELAVSGDGGHLYALDPSGKVVIFERDSASGGLSFQQMISTVSGSAVTGGLILTPADNFLIAATSGGRQVFSRETDDTDPDYGELTATGGTGSSSLASMALSPDARHLYYQLASGQLRVEDFNAGTGGFTNDRVADSTITQPGHITVGADGEHLYASQGSSDRIIALRRVPSTGALTDIDDQSVADGDGEPAILNLDNPGALQVTPDGRHLLIAARNTASIVVLERRAPDPLFEQFELEVDEVDSSGDSGGVVNGLAGATAVAVHDGFVYALGLADSAIAVFSRDPDAGLDNATRGAHLDFVQAITDADLLEPVDLVVTDNWVYVAAQDVSVTNSIQVFARNSTSGLLTHRPDLSVSAGAALLNGVSGLAVSPAGNQLYAVARFDGALNVFNIESGALSLTQTLSNGIGGVQGLAGAIDVAVTRDGRHVLTTATVSNAVAVFARETSSLAPTFGQLSWRQKISAAGAWRIAGSPDDRHFYVTARTQDTVYAVERDAASSSLAFGEVRIVDSYTDGIDGVVGLDGARGVAVDPLGHRVYVASEGSDAAVVFSRNTDSASSAFGTLVPVAVQRNGIDGITGLDGARGVAIAAGGQAYFVALDSGALSAFQLGIGSSCTANGSGAIDDVVTIAKGGAVTYTATGLLRSDTLGGNTQCVTRSAVDSAPQPDSLCNVAEVVLDSVIDAVPAGVCPGASAEACGIDNDTAIAPRANVVMTKTNGQVSAVPGETVTYTVEIINEGPSDASHSASQTVLFTDALDPSLFDVANASWSCEAVGSGSLSFLQSIGTDSGGNALDLDGVSAVVGLDLPLGSALPDLVLSAATLDSSLTAFAVDGNGSLSFQRHIDASTAASLDGLRDIAAVSRGGRHFVYALGQIADAITVLEISDPGSGVPQFTVLQVIDGFSAPGLDQPVDILIDEVRNRVYTASANGDAVHAFDLDPATGELSAVAAVGGFADRIDGLSGASSLALDANTDRLYVGSRENPLIHVLSIDAATGGLQPSLTLDAVDLDVAPAGLSDLLITADGAWLYAALATADAVAGFAVQPAGDLALVEIIDTDSANGSSLLAPMALLLSDDERHLYVAAADSDTVFVLGRDQTSGRLSVSGSVSERNGTAENMARPSGMTFGPAGRLHVAAANSGRLVSFQRRNDSSCPSSGTGAPIDVPFATASGGRVIYRIEVPVSAALDPAETSLLNEAQVEVSIDPTGGAVASDVDVVGRVADLAITKSDGIAEIDGLAGAADLISVAVDNIENIYTAAPGENAVGVFTRNANPASPAFGQLRFDAVFKNQVDGVNGLAGVRRLVASPDGRFLHAISRTDNAVVVFQRDLTTGQLVVTQSVFNGAAGISGMNGPSDAFVTPDGAQLYVAAETGNAIVVFDRDAATGVLTFRQAVLDGTGGTNGLVGPVGLSGSPDGQHVYAVSASSSSVLVFQRNSISSSSDFGRLTFVTRHIDNTGGFDGLAGARDVAVSASGDHAYVLGAGEASLAVLARNATTGELTFLERKADGTGGVSGLANADRLEFGPGQGSIYVAAGPSRSIGRFDAQADGTLSFGELLSESTDVDFLAGVGGLSFSSDGSQLYAVASADDTLSVFELAADVLGAQVQTLIDGRGGVAPGDTVVYEIEVSNLGPGDAANVRVRDLFPAAFDDVRWFCSTAGGAGCIVCPAAPEYCSGNIDQNNVFLPVGGRVTFTAFGRVRPGLTGRLENTATVTAPAGYVDPNLSNNSATDEDTILSPLADLSVALVAGAANLTPGAPADWTLTVSNAGPSAAPLSRLDVAIPDALSNLQWSCVASPAPGLLSDSGFSATAPGPVTTALEMGPNGQFVYAVGDSAVRGFSRDPAAGAITAVQTLRDGISGVDGLGGAADIVFATDGRHAWVPSSSDDSVAIFSVNDESGQLVYLGREVDGINGVNGIGGANAAAVSPDGRHLYIAGSSDNSIAIFETQTDGQLAYLGRIGQDMIGVDGLAGVRDVLVSPDGTHVYAAGYDNAAVAVFARNRTTGILSFVEAQLGFGALSGLLDGPASLAMDTDGEWLLVSASLSDALVVFARDAGSGTLIFDSAEHVADSPTLLAPGQVRLAANNRLVHVTASDAILTFNFNAGTLRPIQSLDAGTIPALTGISGLTIASGFVYVGSDQITALGVGEGSFCGESGRGTLLDEVDLSVGGNVVYSLSADVMQSARGMASIRAGVSPGPGVAEANDADNMATLGQALIADVQLDVVKSDQQSRVVAGTDTHYDLSVSNSGVSDALAVAVLDQPPVWPTDTAGTLLDSSSWACTDRSAFDLSDFSSIAELVDARAATIDALERWLLVAAGDRLVLLENVAGIWTLADELSDGDAASAGTITGLAGASGIVMSDDQAHVYVTGTDSITHFTFDAATGFLGWQSTISNATATPGLRGARAPMLSPDGRQLYVVGESSDAVVVFNRNRDSGTLTWLDRVRDGFGDLPEVGIVDGPVSAAVRSDGRYVYVLSQGTPALAVFARNGTTGRLQLVEVLRNGDMAGTAAISLVEPTQLALTSAGTTIYIADAGSPDLSIVSLDQTTGQAAGIELAAAGDGSGVPAFAVAGDASFLAPISGSSLSILRREWISGALVPIGAASEPALVDTVFIAVSNDRSRIETITASGDLITFGASPYVRCVTDGGAGNLDEQLDLGPGAVAALSLSTTVDPNARGVLQNTAQALAETGNATVDATGLDDSVIDVVNDLAVSFAPQSTEWIAGTQVQYRFTVSNSGPSSALGAFSGVDLDPALTPVSWTCTASDGSSCPASGTGESDISFDLLVGGSMEVTATVLLASGAPPSVNISGSVDPEVAVAPSTAIDSDLSNNTDSLDFEVIYRSDAQIEIADTTEFVAGLGGTFEVTVTNNGPSDAAMQVVVNEPEGFAIAAWTCPLVGPAICDTASGTGAVDVRLDPLVAGDTITLGIDIELDSSVPEGALVTLEAAVAVLAPSQETLPADNSATTTATVITRADLSVIKSASIIAIDTDGETRPAPFHIEVFNAGPSDARDVLLSDLYPPQLESLLKHDCSALIDQPGELTCVLGDLPAAGQIGVDLLFRGGLAATPISNEAVVTSATDDPDLGNNESLATLANDQTVDGWIQIIDPGDRATPGSRFELEVRFANGGTLDAGPVTLNLAMPDWVVAMDWSCAAQTPDVCEEESGSGAIVDHVATLGPAGEVRFVIGFELSEDLDTMLVPAIIVAATIDAPADVFLPNNAVSYDKVTDATLFSDGFEPQDAAP